jgi:hypothetical protein
VSEIANGQLITNSNRGLKAAKDRQINELIPWTGFLLKKLPVI